MLNFIKYLILIVKQMITSRISIRLVTMIAMSYSLFLFIQIQHLTTRIQEVEEEIQLQYDRAIIRILQDSAEPDKKFKNFVDFYKEMKNSGELENLNTQSLNNTPKADIDVVFFHRLPKVGSQFLMDAIRRLSKRNNFLFQRDTLLGAQELQMDLEDQKEIAELVASLEEPSVFTIHMLNINFSRFDLPKPIIINMVRDPVERVISWYYYIRAPAVIVELKLNSPMRPLPAPAWLRKDYDTCVRTGDEECSYIEGEASPRTIGNDHRRQTMFFCGYDDECLPFNSDEALQRAKRSVETQYAVVGVLEDLNITMRVFEKYIPRFFDGVTEIYYNEMESKNVNTIKPTVSEEVKNMVRKNFSREIEFYQFCKQRLYKQYLALNLNLLS